MWQVKRIVQLEPLTLSMKGIEVTDLPDNWEPFFIEHIPTTDKNGMMLVIWAKRYKPGVGDYRD